jgi:ABC-type sugar transport system ATPase subunit
MLALCDRILVLARGRVADEFTKADANEQRYMLAATGSVQTNNLNSKQ